MLDTPSQRGRSRGLRTTFGRLSATRQPYETEYGRKQRFGGSRAQTGSRNMAATRFSDSATPTSYSTSYTLWDLSRTVTAPPAGNINISPF